ncbi:MAG: ribosome silencing factor [Myxococcota bacterium]|nr:ribosome silencing factor [Myxococcota bacterium]
MSQLMEARSDLAKVTRILDAALERNAQRPIVMDIREVTSFADTFVLLSGRSDRQVRAIGESIIEALQHSGESPLGIEGLHDGRWVLIDCNDVIVHVFEPETRDLYALERLWSDAPNIDLLDLGFEPAALEAAGTASSSGRSPEFLR